MTPAELAHRWLSRVKSVPEPAMRRAAVGRLLADAQPEEAAAALGELLGRAGEAEPEVLLLLESIVGCLGDDELLGYEERRALHAAATARGDDDVARLLLQHGPRPDDPALADAEAASRAVIPRGRVLTLGERKAMARAGGRDLLLHLLRDPHPEVVAVLVTNPQLTERDALVLASRRPTLPECQLALWASDRWAPRYRIKRALVLNPYTPLPLALRLATLLRSTDLEQVARDGKVATAVQVHARQLLLRRRGRR